MATLGQALTNPESGWIRVDDTDSSISYTGNWTAENSAVSYNGSRRVSIGDNTLNNKITFTFFGTSIRIIGATSSNTNWASNANIIKIDGVDYTFTNISATTTNQALLFEKTTLSDDYHTVEIFIRTVNKRLWFDAFDFLDEVKEVRLAIKNPTTNQYYSLADKTLILLPDASNENMILHGIEAGEEIKLDEEFNKIRTVNLDGDEIESIVEPFSVYDHISELPQVIIYTESADDITVSTTTEPFDLYDEFGDEVEVLYYTDDEDTTAANLILEANWSPIDELDGDFEVVTWSDEPQDTAQRTLELSAIPLPQLVYAASPITVNDLQDVIMTDLSTYYTTNSVVKVLFTPNNSDWYYFDGAAFIKIPSVTMDNIKKYGNTVESLNTMESPQFNTWKFDNFNVGVYLEDNIRDTIVSKVSEISITDYDVVDTSEVSDTSFYILNTTARIDIGMQGMSVFGTVSDDDSTRVQYRVKLNKKPYFPANGEFTTLAPSPQSISINFTSDEIKIDDWNDVEVEFQDFFGTTDTWTAKFVGRYAGILFADENGALYSTDVGKVLKYLDFGTVLTGQSSPVYTVNLKNEYGFDVKDVNIVANTSEFAEGLQLDFSLDAAMSDFSESISIPRMKNEDEISFYLRMRSPITTEPNGKNLFDIFVTAKRDV